MVVDVTTIDPMQHIHVRNAARETADRAGVSIRLARSNDEIRRVSELLAAIWGTPLGASPGPRNVLTAIADTGGYVVGAWANDSLVGASFGVTYLEGSDPCLRSQVTGALHPRRGVGEALKRHQQYWAVEHGMHRITWTFDPLVRRNAHFNLDRLGARIVRFVPDFYGPLGDGLNGTDDTDRCVVSWTVSDLAARSSNCHSSELLRAGHVAVLAQGAGGTPVVNGCDGDAVLVATPSDIVALRQADPESALAWRRAVRAAFSRAFDAGLIADLFTSDGQYRFRRDEDTQ